MFKITDFLEMNQFTNGQVLRTEKLDAATSQMVGNNYFFPPSFALIKRLKENNVTCVWISSLR